MVNPVDRYLVETEIHLRGRMSPEELEATLSETEQHLRERMEALRELGREPQMASQEAVQAFGPVGLYVHSLMDARRPGQRRLDNAVATWAAVGCAVGSLQLLMFDWPLWQAALLFCLTSLIAVFIGSIRSRKAVPVRISAIAAVAGTAAWLLSPMFFARLGDYGGIGYLPLREASSIYASVPQRERDLAWLREQRALSAWSPTDQQMWLRLRETTGILNMDGLRFYVERDLAAQRQALVAYERWKRSGYFAHLVEHRQPVSEAAALGLVVLLSVNLLGATIGQAVEAIRRRRWARV